MRLFYYLLNIFSFGTLKFMKTCPVIKDFGHFFAQTFIRFSWEILPSLGFVLTAHPYLCCPRYQDNYPLDNYPPDNYPRTNTPRTITPRTITPLGQIPPGHLPPLRNFSSTYLGILCTYILHILFFLEEPNIHFMFHIINPFVYCK